jgi:Transposase DDE domain
LLGRERERTQCAKLYQQEVYHVYIASKKRYSYGVKIHLMVTAQGHPVEYSLTPGSSSDVHSLQDFQFDVPAGRSIYAGKAYNDFGMEDLMKIHAISS